MQYNGYRMFKLLEPTNDSSAFFQGALALRQAIYKSGFNYSKAGVMLMDLSPASRQQLTLDLEPEFDASRGSLMSAMDSRNLHNGSGTVA